MHFCLVKDNFRPNFVLIDNEDRKLIAMFLLGFVERITS